MIAHKLRIGILRLLDCAPVIIARDYGFFADAGLDVTIAIEPSWANIADKLAYGLLDGAIILGPLAVAMTLGLRGRVTALRLAATISRDGNAIVLAPDLARAANLAAALALYDEPPRFAVVHAYSNHDLLLRDWLEAQGVAANDLAIVTLPPAAMAAALETGAIAGFCVGAPWGALAMADRVGMIVATSAAIAPGHPEKLLVLRAEIADPRPELAAALREAIGAATALCRLSEHRADLATLLAQPHNLDLPAAALADALQTRAGNPVFMTGAALLPHRADVAWTIERMRRAGHLAGTASATVVTECHNLLLPASDLF
ncbi:CmpA/NrtA family ABC transporter substrate-binding protein [Acidiphilium sp.]|uniref:CmpA/NrtA family ABC transporter substrate-binding protein n=1 Tax=Acidiphilium sp. TaxID=527 RepID=UPI003D08B78A